MLQCFTQTFQKIFHVMVRLGWHWLIPFCQVIMTLFFMIALFSCMDLINYHAVLEHPWLFFKSMNMFAFFQNVSMQDGSSASIVQYALSRFGIFANTGLSDMSISEYWIISRYRLLMVVPLLTLYGFLYGMLQIIWVRAVQGALSFQVSSLSLVKQMLYAYSVIFKVAMRYFLIALVVTLALVVVGFASGIGILFGILILIFVVCFAGYLYKLSLWTFMSFISDQSTKKLWSAIPSVRWYCVIGIWILFGIFSFLIVQLFQLKYGITYDFCMALLRSATWIPLIMVIQPPLDKEISEIK